LVSLRRSRFNQGLVAQAVCCSFLRRLLTTSKTPTSFHLQKIAAKSLFLKILPLSLTRSRFCGARFKAAQSFQDFRGIPGGGVSAGLHLNLCKTHASVNLPRDYQCANRQRFTNENTEDTAVLNSDSSVSSVPPWWRFFPALPKIPPANPSPFASPSTSRYDEGLHS
jgi:hypothetical protein